MLFLFVVVFCFPDDAFPTSCFFLLGSSLVLLQVLFVVPDVSDVLVVAVLVVVVVVVVVLVVVVVVVVLVVVATRWRR